MTALPVLTETDWARMSWRAKQQWLHAADKLRRQMVDDLHRRLTDEATGAAIRRAVGFDCGTDVARSILRAKALIEDLPADPHGEDHLAELNAEVRRDKQARKMRNLRARHQEAS